MSDNTVLLIKEQPGGTFSVTRHWFDDSLPPTGVGLCAGGLTLRQATAYCDSQEAEYGYQIVWREKEKEAVPIELLYNEHMVAGQFQYDVVRVAVDRLRDRLVIQIPQPGQLILAHAVWTTLVQQVNHQFEEVHQ